MLLSKPQDYMYELLATNKTEATRMWKKAIKNEWSGCCAYCGQEGDTIDHIHAQGKGGANSINNMVCCCEECNKDKGQESVEIWYFQQYFFQQERWEKIEEWRRDYQPVPVKRYIRGKEGIPTRSVIL